jgi:hypothetical protein
MTGRRGLHRPSSDAHRILGLSPLDIVQRQRPERATTSGAQPISPPKPSRKTSATATPKHCGQLAEAETARKVLDVSLPSNTLITPSQ